jgi:hypothetical protein
MSEITRRTLLRAISGAAASAIAVRDLAAAQHAGPHGPEAHADLPPVADPIAPQALTEHEFQTLERLTELVMPSRAGRPGAKETGAAAWIDSMCAVNAELLAIYTGGIAWLDRAVRDRAASFREASASDQRALLDMLAYEKNRTPALSPGVTFFGWVRRMTVDAFYTSRVGSEAVGYRGNQFLGAFQVPQDVIDAMNRKSPL